jgi:hypothetical protein
MDIGAAIVRLTHGWLNSKGMRQEMSIAEDVNTMQNVLSGGTHTQSLWAMLSEHTLERCRNCGMWKHEPLPCTTCTMLENRAA